MKPSARVVAAAVVLTALLAAVAWFAVAGRGLGSVVVEAGWPTCEGAEVSVRPQDDSPDTPFMTPAIPMTKNMECTLTYRVENTSSTDLRISRFVLPVGGPRGGAAFEVVDIQGTSRRELPDDVDAVWTDGVDLPADSHVDLRVVVRFREDGCTDRGAGWTRPTVSVAHLGRSRSIPGPAAPTYLGTRHSTCRGTSDDMASSMPH